MEGPMKKKSRDDSQKQETTKRFVSKKFKKERMKKSAEDALHVIIPACSVKKASKRASKNSLSFAFYNPNPNGKHSRWIALCLGCCVVISSLFVLVSLLWVHSEVFFSRNYEGNLVVGVIASKESTYIEEWLAHHLYLGVDKVVILDNNHPMDFVEKQSMKEKCASFGSRCEIIDFNMYDGKGCLLANKYLCSSMFMPHAVGTSHSFFAPTRRQGMAMKEVYYHDNNYQKYNWVMMFDVDEFLVTKDGNTMISDVLGSLPDDVHAVHVPRYTFGTSNHTTRPDGPVRTSYCWREGAVRNSKGMARPSQVLLPGMSNHFYATKSLASWKGATELPKYKSVAKAESENDKSSIAVLPDGSKGVIKFNHLYIDPEVLVLNHYLTKSTEEFVERRSRSSLNYMYKLKDVYKDDKTSLERYTRNTCKYQRLDKLPSLQNADDLFYAEERRKESIAEVNASASHSTRHYYLRAKRNI